MPDYKLKCNKCGHGFSFFGSWEKRLKEVCPKCGSEKLEQDYTATGSVGIRQIGKTKECPMSEGRGCAGCKHRH